MMIIPTSTKLSFQKKATPSLTHSKHKGLTQKQSVRRSYASLKTALLLFRKEKA
jgi:hypothetical protein